MKGKDVVEAVLPAVVELVIEGIELYAQGVPRSQIAERLRDPNGVLKEVLERGELREALAKEFLP